MTAFGVKNELKKSREEVFYEVRDYEQHVFASFPVGFGGVGRFQRSGNMFCVDLRSEEVFRGVQPAESKGFVSLRDP